MAKWGLPVIDADQGIFSRVGAEQKGEKARIPDQIYRVRYTCRSEAEEKTDKTKILTIATTYSLLAQGEAEKKYGETRFSDDIVRVRNLFRRAAGG